MMSNDGNDKQEKEKDLESQLGSLKDQNVTSQKLSSENTSSQPQSSSPSSSSSSSSSSSPLVEKRGRGRPRKKLTGQRPIRESEPSPPSERAYYDKRSESSPSLSFSFSTSSDDSQGSGSPYKNVIMTRSMTRNMTRALNYSCFSSSPPVPPLPPSNPDIHFLANHSQPIQSLLHAYGPGGCREGIKGYPKSSNNIEPMANSIPKRQSSQHVRFADEALDMNMDIENENKNENENDDRNKECMDLNVKMSADVESVKKRKRAPVSIRMFNNPLFTQYNDEEKGYFKKLTDAERLDISAAERKIIELNDTETPIRFKILSSKIDDAIKAIAIKKLNYLYDLDPSSGEFYKTSSWIESVCRLPVGRYEKLPFNAKSTSSEIKGFLKGAIEHMDKTVYGHKDAKQQIIRLLAQWIVNPDSKGMVIGIHGPMGCGKTTLIKDSICEVLQLPFAFIPLGGTSDSSYLEGHSYTYEGATWGKIVDVLMKSKCMNPVFYFDELDKISETSRGDEIVNILMHITDLAQNDRFQDKYFIDFEFDISKSLIIFSYNHEEKINPILKDRMVRIETKGYNTQDKMHIVQKYVLPDVLRQYKFNTSDIVFSDDVIKSIITMIDKEDGVRNLKRAVQDIVSHINLKRLIGGDSDEDDREWGENGRERKKGEGEGEEEKEGKPYGDLEKKNDGVPMTFPYHVTVDDARVFLTSMCSKMMKIPMMYS